MSAPTSPFAFAVCQPGSERWLKAEISRLLPRLNAGWQRPGFVTFKSNGEPVRPDVAPASVFARAWGCSAGPIADAAGIAEVAARVGATRLLLGPRDQGPPDQVPPARQAATDAHAAELEAAVRALRTFEPGLPRDGDVVLDVVTSPEEPSLVGWHVHALGRPIAACGRWPHTIPANAPSKGYSKIAEGLAWAGVKLRPGELVLEIGAAPGGGTQALLDRGAIVVAVDPTPLAPALMERNDVVFLQRPISEVKASDLPGPVAWIACDVNIPPSELLDVLRRLVLHLRPSLRGLLLTIKLSDDRVVTDLPRLLTHIEGLGFPNVRATRLPSNRREVFVAAIRPKLPSA